MDFMADMQTLVKGRLLSMTRYEIEGGQKGGSLWLSKPNTGKNPNNLGLELMKIRMDYAMFDQQKAKHDAGELPFPSDVELLCSIDMGGGNKAVLTAISFKVVKEGVKILESDVDKSTGEIKGVDVKPNIDPNKPK